MSTEGKMLASLADPTHLQPAFNSTFAPITSDVAEAGVIVLEHALGT